ncbi:hypothetical protein ACB094_01G370500 [Castanea mollissima]
MLKHLESPLSLESCIYRVPDYLRKLKEEHYTPQVISIGPFHHDANDKLHTMEQRKLRYLKYFIERVENFDISLEDLVRIIKENEESIRCYYYKDAIFILELFWRDFFNDWMSEDNGARLETWLISAIRFDLILLENQLPFFILEKLFDYAFASHPRYSRSLIQVMTFYYFDYYNTQRISNDVIKHLHSATQLREAGLVFKKDPSSCLLDIKFTKGALRMPPLTLDNPSVTIIRNLLALEQCHYSDKAYITDYFILFGFLINTNKDVDLLVRKGVMLNLLGNSDEARNLVNSLVENVIYVDMNSNFYRVCKDLNAFYKKPWNRWHATLRRDYFSSPWSIASTAVAFIFLVLTLQQTLYTIKG